LFQYQQLQIARGRDCEANKISKFNAHYWGKNRKKLGKNTVARIATANYLYDVYN
jgi:hypothetical protein